MIKSTGLMLSCWLMLISPNTRAEDFDSWRASLAAEATAAGISPATIQATFEVPFAHPRKLSSPAMQQMKEQILGELGVS